MKAIIRTICCFSLFILFMGTSSAYTNPPVATDYPWAIGEGDSIIFHSHEWGINNDGGTPTDYHLYYFEKINIGKMEDQTEKFEVNYETYHNDTDNPDFETMDDWSFFKGFTSVLNKSVDGLISQDFFALPTDVGLNDILVPGFLYMIGGDDPDDEGFPTAEQMIAYGGDVKYWIVTETPIVSGTPNEGSYTYILDGCVEFNAGYYIMGQNFSINVNMTAKLDGETHIFDQIYMDATGSMEQYNVTDGNASLGTMTLDDHMRRNFELLIKGTMDGDDNNEEDSPFIDGFPLLTMLGVTALSLFALIKKNRK